jgi:tetratricopeptide (TPR) repeat protein
MELGMETEIGRALNGLGSVALYLGDYQKAYAYLSRYLRLIEPAGRKSEFCTALLGVGQVLVKLKDYTAAECYLQRALSICRTLGFQRLLGVSLIDLGLLALEQNQLEQACGYLQEGIEAVRTVGTQRQIIRGLSALGYAELRQENFAAACEHLQEGLQYICDLQRNLTEAYLVLNNLDAARCSLHESLIIAKRLGSYPQQVKTLSSAIAYYRCLGWTQRAAKWAGVLMGNAEIDEALFKPVCLQLEATLGHEAYRQALEQGKALTLDDVMSEVLKLLDQSSEGLTPKR